MPDRVHLEEAHFELQEVPDDLEEALWDAFNPEIPMEGVVVVLRAWPAPGKATLCTNFDGDWYQLIREVRS